MTLTALRKAAASSKVLLFLIYATAITVAMALGKVEAPVWLDKLEVGFGLLMGGYSAVETARAIMAGKVAGTAALADPKAAMDAAELDEADDDDSDPPPTTTKAAKTVLVLLALGLMGCTSAGFATHNALIRSVNAAQPALIKAEDAQARAAVLEIIATCTDEREICKARAVSKNRSVGESWAPVWKAWAAAVASHDSWATAVEKGAPTDLLAAAAKESWCALVAVVGERHKLPKVFPCH